MKIDGFQFEIDKRLGRARTAYLKTPHGKIETPFFQFVATQAAIRGQVFSEDLEALGVQLVLANTYHLHLRPGEELVEEAGGLHQFMQWNGSMTTDSGGYQVFSLGGNVELDDEGVTFRSPLDGAKHRFTPEKAMRIQEKLGGDIIMPLDVCTPYRANQDEVSRAVEMTRIWAERCLKEHERLQNNRKNQQALYGIVQGGVYPELRKRSAEGLRSLDMFGYSVGGELRDVQDSSMAAQANYIADLLPVESPRYLMGAGAPEDIVSAVRAGFDQFDTVFPVRNARHGRIYRNLKVEYLEEMIVNSDKPIEADKLYEAVNVKRAEWRRDWSVFSPNNPVIKKPYTMAYVHHLLRTEAPSGFRLAVLNNIYFYLELMRQIRRIIRDNGN
jgi:queuine tRNA-ribosyltransferase